MSERVVATAKKPEAKKTCSNFSRQNTGFNSSGPTVDMILQLQKTAGNRAVQKLIKLGALQAKLRIGQPNDIYEQEADRVAEQVMKMPESKVQSQPAQKIPLIQRQQTLPLLDNGVISRVQKADFNSNSSNKKIRPTISPEVEASMNADVEFIVGKLKQQALWDDEERQVLQRIKKWSDEDQRYAQNTGYQGSDYLDKFIFHLKMRTYTRRTARSAWLEQWSSAFDDLWYEIEDKRLDEFKSIISRSKKQAAVGPSTERMENAWSYVGKRELMGGTGILKAMGLAVTGVVDTAIWVQWKTTGAPLRSVLKMAGVEVPENSPQISKYIDKSFDESADFFAQKLGVDLNEELFAGMSSYEFGATAGKVPAALMLGGALAKAGAAGQAIGIAQTAQQTEGLYDYVKELHNKGISWDEIVKDPQVWMQVVGVISGAIGSAGGFAGAQSKAAQVLTKLNYVGNTSQVGVMVAAYMVIDNDPKMLSAEKSKRKAELLADMISTGAMMINDRYGKDFEKAWAEKFGKKTGKEKLPIEETKPLASTEEPTKPEKSSKVSETFQTYEVSASPAETPKEQKSQKITDAEMKAKGEAEAKVRAESEAKAKEEIDIKAKTEAEEATLPEGSNTPSALSEASLETSPTKAAPSKGNESHTVNPKLSEPYKPEIPLPRKKSSRSKSSKSKKKAEYRKKEQHLGQQAREEVAIERESRLEERSEKAERKSRDIERRKARLREQRQNEAEPSSTSEPDEATPNFPIEAKPSHIPSKETIEQFEQRGGKVKKLKPGKMPKKLPSEFTTISEPTPPEGFEDMPDFEPIDRKRAGVSLQEDHHISSRYNKKSQKMFKMAGMDIDAEINKISDFEEHGQLRGCYDWEDGNYIYHRNGHHRDYKAWVNKLLWDGAPPSLTSEQAKNRIIKVLSELGPIIRKNPEVLTHGPKISPELENLKFEWD